MKKLFIFSMLLFTAITAFSQNLIFQKSLREAVEKANKSGKLIFIEIDARPHPHPFPFTSAIDKPEVSSYYNKTFINYRAMVTDTAALSALKDYQIGNTFPCYLFLDNEQNLVYRETGNSIQNEKYLNMAEKALTAVKSGRTISNYQKKYKAGNTSKEFLKDYIILREELGLYDNAKLIDEYVDQLIVKSFDDYQEVLFILKAGPYVYGKAYTFSYTNKKIIDSIYKHEPVEVRVAINDRIANNTEREAIRTQNLNMAMQAANMVRALWSRDYRKGNRAYTSRILTYYLGIKDTTNYYQQASFFYDAYYMNISADSAKKRQQEMLNQIKQKAEARYAAKPIKSSGTDTLQKRLMVYQSSSEPSSIVATTLNNAAYQFYTLGTRNPNYLVKALLWSRRSLELSENEAYYDTLAHILYRLGFYEEAQVTQHKAVEMAQKNNTDPVALGRYKEEFAKIKQRKL